MVGMGRDRMSVFVPLRCASLHYLGFRMITPGSNTTRSLLVDAGDTMALGAQ